MSAVAPQILVGSPVFLQAPALDPAATQAIRELVHELRQPLSSIEAIAYYVEMTLPPDQIQARQQLRRLQELVERAEGILEDAASTVRMPAASAASAS